LPFRLAGLPLFLPFDLVLRGIELQDRHRP
jgi:hypothetical protein